MTITSTTLLRGAAAAAMTAGALFIGVQIGHPHLDADSVTTTEVVLRNSVKALMALLALVGISGMYLRQVRQTGVLGLIGYLVLALGYVLIAGTVLMAAHVLPAVAVSDPAYVDDVVAAMTGGTPQGDLGTLRTLLHVQDLSYLVGGLLFGVALFRGRVLARWATVLLAVAGVISAVVSVLPDPFYRLVAVPNGVALLALGYSLWRSVRTADSAHPVGPVDAADRVDPGEPGTADGRVAATTSA